MEESGEVGESLDALVGVADASLDALGGGDVSLAPLGAGACGNLDALGEGDVSLDALVGVAGGSLDVLGGFLGGGFGLVMSACSPAGRRWSFW